MSLCSLPIAGQNPDRRYFDRELTAENPENKRIMFSNLFYLCVLSEFCGEKNKK